MPNTDALLIGDSNDAGFVVTDLSAQPALAPMGTDQDGMVTLTGDGLTIIGTSDDGSYFLQASRAAIGSTVFGPVSNTVFAALNVNAPTRIDFPVISNDGLAIYFRRINSANSIDNGLYESVRASKDVPFPAATKMPGGVQGYAAVMGISSDRMAIFVENNAAQMAALTRKSVKDPFANPSAPAPPPVLPGFHTRPLSDCQTVFATDTSGGCDNEEIAIFTR